MIDPTEFEAFQANLVFGSLEDQTLIEVRGSDRITFLHNLCTNDVKSLQTGYGCEAFFTNVSGKTICHALLFARDESTWICTDPDIRDRLLPHLDKYIIREDVELLDRSGSMATHVLAGPRASAWVAETLGMPLGDLQHAAWPDLPDVWLARVPYALPTAFFAFVPQAAVADVASRLTSQGAVPAGPELLEFGRIQARFPASGRDVTIDNLPQEIGRDQHAISFVKGCYLGQETIARIDALGHVNQHLVALQFTGGALPPPATPVLQEGKPVGYVTSSCLLPDGNGALALGYVRREVLLKQTELTSDLGTVHILT